MSMRSVFSSLRALVRSVSSTLVYCLTFVLSVIFYNTLYRVYVLYCVHIRPFPIPYCDEAHEADADELLLSSLRGRGLPPLSGGRLRRRKRRGDAKGTDGFVIRKRQSSSSSRSSCSSGGGIGRKERTLQFLLDGSRIAHNTYLTCVRNRVRVPAEGSAAGGGFFLVPEEDEAHTQAREKSGAKKDTTDKKDEAEGILFSTLEEAVIHAHKTAMLLVVYLHSEVSATSQTLLREIIVYNTANIQRFLSNNVVFYLLSASGSEASGLLQSVAMGQAFPAILVFNANQEVKTEDGSPQSSVAVVPEDPRHSSGTARTGIRFVSSMEGVGCVADLYSYLRECEKRYMSWM